MRLLWVLVGLIAFLGLLARPLHVVRVRQQNEAFVGWVQDLDGGQELAQGLQSHLGNMLSYMDVADALFMLLIVMSLLGILLPRGNKKVRAHSGDQACS